jgi:competence protein ComEA
VEDFLERRRVHIIAFLLIVIGVGLAVLAADLKRQPQLSSLVSQSGTMGVRSGQATFPVIQITERQLKAHVVGEVQHPGVYTFRDGDRVEDVIRAAGGATADADLSRLNLAQRLRDEGYVTVPNKNATPIPVSGVPSSSSLPGERVNLNTASLKELDALPGIGATYAQRILDYRAQNGPFLKANDLVTRKIIPQSTFDKIANLVDVW